MFVSPIFCWFLVVFAGLWWFFGGFSMGFSGLS